MNIDQMIAALEAIKAEEGNLTVAFWEYMGGMEDLHEAAIVVQNGGAVIVWDGGPALDQR